MKKQPMTVKIAVLSLAFVGMTNAFIAPVMAAIATAFPEASRTNIQLIMTFGMFGFFPMTLVSGWLAGKFRAKPLVMLGSALIVFGAFFPLIFHNHISYLYFSALLMGMGQGIALTMAGTLITHLFDEPERSRLFGFNGSLQQAGSMIMMFAAGIFAASQWYNVYWTGLFCIPTFILVICFLPWGETLKASVNNQKSNLKFKGWHPAALPVALFVLLFAIAFATNIINFAMLLDEQLQQGSAMAGIISSIAGFISILAGIIYKNISNKLKHNILWVGALLLTVGLFASYTANYVIVFFVGICCTNLGFTLGFIGGMHAMSRVVPAERVASSMGLFMGCQALGSMVCPYVINPIAELVIGSSTARGNYQIAVVWGLVVVVFAIFWGIKNRNYYLETTNII